MWGLVFVAPLLLRGYRRRCSVGRYLAFGRSRCRSRGSTARAALAARADWLEALKLVGRRKPAVLPVLAAAIQRAGGPLPTMIIGTLPVVIAVASNLRDARRDGRLPWLRLMPSLALIAAGIALVNHVEFSAARRPDLDRSRYAARALLAAGAVACWTWYPIRDGDWLRAHADRSPRGWATAQGVMTMPLPSLVRRAGAVECAGRRRLRAAVRPTPQRFIAPDGWRSACSPRGSARCAGTGEPAAADRRWPGN